MIKLREETSGDLLALELSGLLTHEDFEFINPICQRAASEHESLRILLVLRDFHGYSVQGNWAKTVWVYETMPRVACMAIVGPERDATAMALAGAFTSSRPIEAFSENELSRALDWLQKFIEAGP